MAGSRHSYTMHGGGPWGVRLMGGDGDPLIVARLRQRSKAASSGLIEGDVVVRINEIDTVGMGHATASRLLENAGQNLTIDVIRGGSAFLAAPGQSLGLMPSSGPSRSPVPMVRVSTPDITAPIQREEQVFDEGSRTRHVKTETQQQKFGSTTVTKTTREINTRDKLSPQVFSPSPQRFSPAVERPHSPRRHRPVPPPHQHQGFTPVQPERASPAPQTYSPVFAPAPQNAYRRPGEAPAASPMHQNPDGSFTMTVGMGNLQSAPVPPPRHVPQFKVKKVATAQPKMGTWQPGASAFQPAPQRARTPSPPPSPPRPTVWQPSQPAEPVFRNPRPQPAYVPEAEPESDYYVDSDYTRQVEMEPIELHKYQRGAEFSSDDEYYMDHDTQTRRRRSQSDVPQLPPTSREKIFADSSFYDDPEHRYPTIEEQIKMARKVAMSLMAPQNKEARGHKMFMRRRKKSDRWIAGQRGAYAAQMEYDQPDFVEGCSDEEEKYYNPNPWRASGGYDEQTGSHTWQSQQPSAPQPWQAPRPFKPAPAPAAPPPPPQWEPRAVEQPHLWAPKLPSASEMRPEQEQALSMDEFERMRLQDQKNRHDAIAPQVCFNLADDLRNMKGRGGKLFAKRRERAEQWVVDDSNVQSNPNPDIMRRIAMKSEMERPHSPAPAPEPEAKPMMNGMPVNRLSSMVSAKAPMTPWEAAEKSTSGNIEAAFSHLHKPFMTSMKRPGGSSRQPSSVFTPAPQAYNQRPSWGSSSHPSVSGNASSVSAVVPEAGAASSLNYNNHMTPWQGGGEASGGSSNTGSRFRPINFKPPLGSQSRMGIFESTTAQQPWTPHSAASSQAGDGGSSGYCDL